MAIMRCIDVLSSDREMTVDEFKAWIRRFDADKDGQISREELEEALRSLHIWFGGWKARRGMKAADSNRTGKIEGTKEVEMLVQYARQQLRMKIYDNEF